LHNLEEGIDFITENARIKAVILDGHCFVQKNQKEPPSQNFVSNALLELAELKGSQERVLPFCVCTAHPADFEADLEGIAPVFAKGQDHEAMFAFLKSQIKQLPQTRIREQHPLVFDDLELLFDQDLEDELIRLIMLNSLQSEANAITLLTTTRRLLEAALAAMCRKMLNKDPESFAKGRGSYATPVTDALRQQGKVPLTVLQLSQHTYSFCSRYGSHTSLRDDRGYKPGLYAAERMVVSLLEVLSSFIKTLKDNE
jgi:hypothetical protein